jgi:hypothetical protein
MRLCNGPGGRYVTGRMTSDPTAPARPLSAELAELHARTAEQPVTLGEVIAVLRGRAYLLLVALIALPFLTPIPMVGLSTPFGVVIALVALRLALGLKPWLPARLLRREVPAGFFGRVLGLARGIVGAIERLARPRLTFVTATGALVRLHALVMLGSALALMLPLPIPFTNSLPAWAILLLAVGLLERDGAAVLLGYGMAALTVAYFVVLGEAAAHVVEWWRSGVAG